MESAICTQGVDRKTRQAAWDVQKIDGRKVSAKEREETIICLPIFKKGVCENTLIYKPLVLTDMTYIIQENIISKQIDEYLRRRLHGLPRPILSGLGVMCPPLKAVFGTKRLAPRLLSLPLQLPSLRFLLYRHSLFNRQFLRVRFMKHLRFIISLPRYILFLFICSFINLLY